MVGALPLVTSYDPYLSWRDTPVRFASDERAWQQEVKWCVNHQDQVRADAAAVREIVLAERGLTTADIEWSHALNATTVMQYV